MKPLSQYIIESQHELYHYTNVGNAINICAYDKFIASEDDGHNPKGYEYYISTTRQRNALTGYPTGMLGDDLVRFVFDGTSLNKFKIVPLDWGKAKGRAIKKNWPAGGEDFDKNITSIMLQTNVESEDRILLKKPEVNDIHKYIKEIHIDNTKVSPSEFHLFQTYCDLYNIRLMDMDHKQFILGR